MRWLWGLFGCKEKYVDFVSQVSGITLPGNISYFAHEDILLFSVGYFSLKSVASCSHKRNVHELFINKQVMWCRTLLYRQRSHLRSPKSRYGDEKYGISEVSLWRWIRKFAVDKGNLTMEIEESKKASDTKNGWLQAWKEAERTMTR